MIRSFTIAAASAAVLTLSPMVFAQQPVTGEIPLPGINSAEQGSQSVGRLPVKVHSAQAHGMTVPGF
jgi:hypothetical protein